VNLQLSVSLSISTGTVSTFYGDGCNVSNQFWTLGICKAEGAVGPDEGGNDSRKLLSLDNGVANEVVKSARRKTKKGVKKRKEGCSFVELHPETLESTLELSNLEPCTTYSFSLQTSHVVGGRRESISEETVITDTTKCSGSSAIYSEDAWFSPEIVFSDNTESSYTPASQSNLPFSTVLCATLVISLLLCLTLFFLKRHVSPNSLTVRKYVKQEGENLL